MNLYIDPYCQVLASSAVGMWNNTTPVANVAGIRWEGTAPSTDPPGTLRRTGFPPGTAEQAPVSTHHSSGKADQFVMDPSKGKVVVALVSVVLVVGIVIGLCLVYRAAQYVPPPKEYSAAPLSGALLGEKKVKRKQAYYKKPSKEDQTLLANESMVENRGRSRLSVQQQQRRSRGELPYTGSVLIDIIQGDMYRPCQINPPSISQQAGGRVGEVVVPMHQLG
ncbi:hypothetical protein BGZ54_010240 [Gamsiella multidivaricata]|nr:hypothetical protein BGZ54_010240 [Gamsiella multidivaricata]